MTWVDFVREYGPSVYRTAWRILAHAQDCEDVVQDVFIEAHPLFEAGKVDHWTTFLNRLATFRAIDLLRRRRPIEQVDPETAIEATATAEQRLVATELEAQIRRIIASLPERQAAVFCLVHFEEYTNSRVAQLLDISENAVALALHKARCTLRERLSLREKGYQT